MVLQKKNPKDINEKLHGDNIKVQGSILFHSQETGSSLQSLSGNRWWRPREGSPSTSVTLDNLSAEDKFVMKDRCLSVRHIAAKMYLSYIIGQTHSRLLQDGFSVRWHMSSNTSARILKEIITLCKADPECSFIDVLLRMGFGSLTLILEASSSPASGSIQAHHLLKVSGPKLSWQDHGQDLLGWLLNLFWAAALVTRLECCQT